MLRLSPSDAIITDPVHLRDVVDYYVEQPGFCFDTETVGGDFRGVAARNRVTWLSMATEGAAHVIPMGHPHGERIRAGSTVREVQYDPRVLTEKTQQVRKQRVSIKRPAAWTPAPKQLDPEQAFELLEPLMFADNGRTIVAHNAVFDLATVAKYYDGRIPYGPYGDTMIAAKLVLPDNERVGLKELTKRLWDHDYDRENVGKQVEVHPFSKVAKYALLDAFYTWELWKHLVPLLDANDLDTVFNDIEMDVLPCTVTMVLSGMRVDRDKMRELGERLDDELHEVVKEIAKATGQVLDLNKPTDVRRLVYDIRGHAPFAFTDKTKDLPPDQQVPSTAKNVIEVYAGDPVIANLMKYRKLDKLQSTYTGKVQPDGTWGGGISDWITPGGRVYTSLKQMGAATGRYSSSQINLQNIPSRGEAGDWLRELFIAEDGHLYVVADYSQIEYRVLAHLSGDPVLTQAFVDGFDPHAATAAVLLGKPIEDVTDGERSIAKNANFAVVYGSGPGKVAGMMQVSLEEAKKFLADHEVQFPTVYKWKADVIRKARVAQPKPHVRTMFGRRRILRALTWNDRGLRSQAERQAVNTIVQGTAADIIKRAMSVVYKGCLANNWKPVLSVHDEIILSVPEDEAKDAAVCLSEWMLSVNPLNVPLEADAGVGPSWKEAK